MRPDRFLPPPPQAKVQAQAHHALRATTHRWSPKGRFLQSGNQAADEEKPSGGGMKKMISRHDMTMARGCRAMLTATQS